MLHSNLPSSNKPKTEIPPHLICPVTFHMYLTPVTLVPSGHTIEKDAADGIIKEAEEKGTMPLCPKSRLPIEKYVIAWGIKEAVEDYLEKNPEASKERYTPVTSPNTHNNNEFSSSTPSEQEREDEAMARELQREEEVRAERERRSLLAMRQRQERELQQRRIENQAQQNRNANLTLLERKEREALINDVQDIIFALKFEKGPLPRGTIQNDSLLFFALIESAFLQPLPWQKIEVKEGPKSSSMHEVLKAAIAALKELNPEILTTEKNRYAGQYDLVKTILGGEVSLSNGGYASFAKAMGTIRKQPGYHVDQILLRVDHMLKSLCNKYSIQPSQTLQPRVGMS